MRKLIESTLVSLDGVVEAPHTWTGRYWDEGGIENLARATR